MLVRSSHLSQGSVLVPISLYDRGPDVLVISHEKDALLGAEDRAVRGDGGAVVGVGAG
jgi:hypothetical protein